jgi:hypothetical protein
VGKRTALSTTTKRGRVEKVEIAGYGKVVKVSNKGSLTAAKVVEHEFRYAGNKKQYDINQSVSHSKNGLRAGLG